MIHSAACLGDLKVLRFLIDRPDADLEKKNSAGLTPAEYAARGFGEGAILVIREAIERRRKVSGDRVVTDTVAARESFDKRRLSAESEDAKKAAEEAEKSNRRLIAELQKSLSDQKTSYESMISKLKEEKMSSESLVADKLSSIEKTAAALKDEKTKLDAQCIQLERDKLIAQLDKSTFKGELLTLQIEKMAAENGKMAAEKEKAEVLVESAKKDTQMEKLKSENAQLTDQLSSQDEKHSATLSVLKDELLIAWKACDSAIVQLDGLLCLPRPSSSEMLDPILHRLMFDPVMCRESHYVVERSAARVASLCSGNGEDPMEKGKPLVFLEGHPEALNLLRKVIEFREKNRGFSISSGGSSEKDGYPSTD